VAPTGYRNRRQIEMQEVCQEPLAGLPPAVPIDLEEDRIIIRHGFESPEDWTRDVERFLWLQVYLDIVRPGRPTEDWMCWSLCRWLCNECLSICLLWPTQGLRRRLEAMRRDCDAIGSHSALGRLTSGEYAAGSRPGVGCAPGRGISQAGMFWESRRVGRWSGTGRHQQGAGSFLREVLMRQSSVEAGCLKELGESQS